LQKMSLVQVVALGEVIIKSQHMETRVDSVKIVETEEVATLIVVMEVMMVTEGVVVKEGDKEVVVVKEVVIMISTHLDTTKNKTTLGGELKVVPSEIITRYLLNLTNKKLVTNIKIPSSSILETEGSVAVPLARLINQTIGQAFKREQRNHKLHSQSTNKSKEVLKSQDSLQAQSLPFSSLTYLQITMKSVWLIFLKILV